MIFNATARPITWTLETWPIQALVAAVRHDLASDKVAALVHSLADGNTLPPVFVLVDGTITTILDGHHRIAAWATAGFPAGRVIVGRPK